jgi:hypothetical protein
LLTAQQRHQFQTELDDLVNRYGLEGIDLVGCFVVNLISACSRTGTNPLDAVMKGMIINAIDLAEGRG